MKVVVINAKRSLWQRVVALLLAPFRMLRKWIVSRLLVWRSRLQIGSLRKAINNADQDKEKTGRKNMVVFNTATGQYEPVQKKLLKTVAEAGKNKSNKAMTEGRKRELSKHKRRKRVIDQERVKHIEEKSLYVTK